ncbi:DUF4424 family protein [Klebsiella aerogenes]|uniref:DUF4424 family protein n=1 Tax=Klebsiella aerogenes TaxID=548 RepID=UPI001BD4A776|nr:DUF4424 family protein [Klebsiella aerogenes]
MKGIIRLIFLLLTMSPAAYANDTSIGEVNGSIAMLKQNDVSMEKERLLISPQRINVDYLFINHGQQDVTLPVAFPMPPKQFDSGQDHNPGIMNFKLSVDGKPVKPQVRWVAQLLDDNGHPQEDITNKLLKIGWTVEKLRDVITSDDFFKQPDNLPALPKSWMKYGGANLAVQQYFIWQQTFPAGKEVMINHSYTPSMTSGVPREFADITDKKCLTDDNRKRLAQLRSRYKTDDTEDFFPGFNWSEISYILTTGANWKGGVIGDFTLRVHTNEPKEVAAVCFNYSLKQIDPLTQEFKQKNFRPERDLSVIYLSASR